MQVFTRNNMTWKVKPLTDDAVAAWHEAAAPGDVAPVVAHDSYLINLGAPDPAVFARSRAAFADELDRCARLRIPYLVMHPGAPKDKGDAWGLERIAGALQWLLDDHDAADPVVLLECTAGQGSHVGHRFEHLAALLDGIDRPGRVGICLDTCHLFAAGYDISTQSGWDATIAALDAVVGVEHVHCVHVNDAKTPLGSRVDRHEHLGQGHIGMEAFRALMHDSRFRDLPKILETPKTGADKRAMDPVNLTLLRQCAGRPGPRTRTRRNA